MTPYHQPSAPKSKRGLAWAWDNPKESFSLYAPAAARGTISWAFNWELWKPDGLPPSIEYVPQIRTAREAPQTIQFIAGLNPRPVCLLGFNEPDIDSQANLSVAEAARLWREIVLPAKAEFGLRLGSPAISNAPQGKRWLKEFLDALGGVQASGVDFVVCHWYGVDVADFKRHLTDLHETFRMNLWMNEFACTSWDPSRPRGEEEVLRFTRDAMDFLDTTNFVERYAAFGTVKDVGDAVGRGNNLEGGRGLTRIGELYVS